MATIKEGIFWVDYYLINSIACLFIYLFQFSKRNSSSETNSSECKFLCSGQLRVWERCVLYRDCPLYVGFHMAVSLHLLSFLHVGVSACPLYKVSVVGSAHLSAIQGVRYTCPLYRVSLFVWVNGTLVRYTGCPVHCIFLFEMSHGITHDARNRHFLDPLPNVRFLYG